MDNDKLIRTGENTKEVVVRKDVYINLKYEDIISSDGLIKQDAMKFFLFANTMKKVREVVREYLIRAIREGHKAHGVLQASIVEGKPSKELDKDMLGVVLAKHGYTLEQFYRTGEPKVRLNVE